jgi:hypothetical protein
MTSQKLWRYAIVLALVPCAQALATIRFEKLADINTGTFQGGFSRTTINNAEAAQVPKKAEQKWLGVKPDVLNNLRLLFEGAAP